jgi:hypothetical protein
LLQSINGEQQALQVQLSSVDTRKAKVAPDDGVVNGGDRVSVVVSAALQSGKRKRYDAEDSSGIEVIEVDDSKDQDFLPNPKRTFL